MKYGLPVILCLVFFAFMPKIALASVVSVDKNGNIVWNVLSAEDSLGVVKPQTLTVTSVSLANTAGSSAEISLSRLDGRVSLDVKDNGQNKSLDVSGLTGDVIDIEARPQVQSLKIGLLEDKFSLIQGDVIATTVFPISVDPKTASLSVLTDSGNRYILIFPRDAFSDAVRAKIISKLGQNGVSLLENAKGELNYHLSGVKTINIFNLATYDVPTTADISATTGEVLKIDQPVWYRLLSFLFS